MKAKSVLSHDSPRKLEDALDGIDEELLERVLIPHLKVDPAKFEWGDEFVQTCDFSVRPKRITATDHICIATLTMVSGPNANGNRASNDLPRARDAMVALWSEKLKLFMPTGHKTRLSVVIALDESIPQREGGQQFRSNLIEIHGVWISGEADPVVCPIYVGKRSKRD